MNKETLFTWIARIVFFAIMAPMATASLYGVFWVLIQIFETDILSKLVMSFGFISTVYFVWRYAPRDNRHIPEEREQRRITRYFLFFQIILYLANRFIVYSRLLLDYQKILIPAYAFAFIIIGACIEEMILDITPKKARERWIREEVSKITISEKGDDNPWFGDMRYKEEAPVEKTFIRGFKDNVSKLAEIITNISGEHSLLFYVLYEPRKNAFDEIINFADEHGLYHHLMTSNLGESLAIECNNKKNLEKILSLFWVEEYICWIVAHDRSFTNMAEHMHKTLNPVSFPAGFHELIQSNYCFFRDVEYGRTLLIITDKLRREKISKLII